MVRIHVRPLFSRLFQNSPRHPEEMGRDEGREVLKQPLKFRGIQHLGYLPVVGAAGRFSKRHAVVAGQAVLW